MKVQILDEVEQDLVDGYRFYESQVAGLGDSFLDSLFSDIDSLQFHAGIHSLHFGYNRLLSKRFPFAVYYRIENDVVPHLCHPGLQAGSILDSRPFKLIPEPAHPVATETTVLQSKGETAARLIRNVMRQ